MTLLLLHNQVNAIPAGTRRNNNVFTTSTRRRRRRVDVLFASFLRYVSVGMPACPDDTRSEVSYAYGIEYEG